MTYPTHTDFWRPGGADRCWVCGRYTVWAYLDINWQHPDCDGFPTEDGQVYVIGDKHCVHHWVDPTNEVVDANGHELCVNCGRIQKT